MNNSPSKTSALRGPKFFGPSKRLLGSNYNRFSASYRFATFVIASFAVLWLSYGFRGLFAFSVGQGGAVAAVTVVIYAVMGLHLLRQGVKEFDWSFLVPLVPIALAAASVGWSSDPQGTAFAIVSLLGCFVAGVSLVSIFGLDLPRMISFAFSFYLFLTIPLYFYGLDLTVYTARDTAFQAFSGHKNQVGAIAGILSIFAYSSLRIREGTSYLQLGMLLLGLITLMLSRASTSLVAVVGAIAFFEVLLYSFRSSHPQILMIIASVVIGGLGLVLILSSFDGFLSLLGEDRTLSSRTRIWAIAIHVFQQNPVMGVGHDALWDERGTAAYLTHHLFTDAVFKQAHNGYIQLAAELGIIGLIVTGVVYARIFLQMFRAATIDLRMLPFMAFFGFLIFHNLGETNLLVGNYVMFALICSCAAAASQVRKDHRLWLSRRRHQISDE